MFGKRRPHTARAWIDAETHVAMDVPIGAIIEILVAPPDSVRMVDVLLHAKPVIMFLWDLKSRSEVVVES